MNRAKKRHQKKLARKGIKKRGHPPQAPRQAAGGVSEVDLSELIQKGLRLHQAGQMQEAETAYHQILDINPDHVDANHLLGVLANQAGNHEQALASLLKATALEPGFADAHNNLGNALCKLDRLEDAVDSYKKAVDLKPEYAEANYNLGNTLQSLGRLEDAVDNFRKALALKPDYAEAHNNLGNALRSLGRLEDAVASGHKAVALKPNDAMAHNNLGNTLQDLGRLEDAVASYHKALAIQPDYVEAHNNLGVTLDALGRLEEAVASYHKALAIQPDLAEAHNNLGNALRALGRLGEAVASYHKAIALKPDLADAHCNLGITLHETGKLDEAVASYHEAIAIKPDYAEAHNNLGVAFQGLGRLDEAMASFHKALAINPDFAEAHSTLGFALLDLGKVDEAFTSHRRAVALNPQNDVLWAGLARSLETLSFTSVDDDLFQCLLQLLERPTVRPSFLVRPIISALRHHPGFSEILERTGSASPEIGISYGDVAEQLSSIPLFLRIMGLSPIDDLEIERMLTFLRRAMTKETGAGNTDGKGLPFSAALALQCFTNEYVFPETDEEKTAIEHTQQQIAVLVEKKRDVPPSLVAALGAYRPLHDFPWARELAGREWTGAIKEVIERQISEPREEQSLRTRIPRLTAIENAVSQSVREQYEENPYPRWIKIEVGDKGRPIGAILQEAPLRFDLGDYQSPESPEILVAGCGTGQNALNTASRFSNARVLAMDLSLSSLSYALRKTKELGFSNIEYVQGDIMELSSLGRRFDLIESSGVLHHLGDPLAGWKILVDLLGPGGLMLIGLYSETARQDIIDGRALIAEKGYTASPEDIRRCRQDIIAMAEDGNRESEKIRNSWDFYSLSNCRDLLFHVQEHRFTLPGIDDALTSLKLKFLGFQIRDQITLKKFRESHPNKDALTSLALWHKFELKNPDTFRGMYQFWCKKM